jgi:hypothetical protein
VFCRRLKRLSNSHTGTGRPGPDNGDDDQLALQQVAVSFAFSALACKEIGIRSISGSCLKMLLKNKLPTILQ